MVTKYIVITTIYPLSKEINAFREFHDWKIIVIGDRKSPNIKDSSDLQFLSVENQLKTNFRIVTKLPYDHYSRKNIGYLCAMRSGASIIFETDDDNYPAADWDVLQFICTNQIASKTIFVNVYSYFTDQEIWPRGFPLQYINNPDSRVIINEIKNEEIGVWQGLVNGNPDVDAIFRLTRHSYPGFKNSPPVFIKKNNFCPFNSQNTTWNKKAFPLMYLPSYTSFRFTDIIRGYICQKLMWERGLFLGFHYSMIRQNRNPHDLMEDFINELEGHCKIVSIIDIINDVDTRADLLEGLLRIYKALTKKKILPRKELELLTLWCEDITLLGLT